MSILNFILLWSFICLTVGFFNFICLIVMFDGEVVYTSAFLIVFIFMYFYFKLHLNSENKTSVLWLTYNNLECALLELSLAYKRLLVTFMRSFAFSFVLGKALMLVKHFVPFNQIRSLTLNSFKSI